MPKHLDTTPETPLNELRALAKAITRELRNLEELDIVKSEAVENAKLRAENTQLLEDVQRLRDDVDDLTDKLGHTSAKAHHEARSARELRDRLTAYGERLDELSITLGPCSCPLGIDDPADTFCPHHGMPLTEVTNMARRTLTPPDAIRHALDVITELQAANNLKPHTPYDDALTVARQGLATLVAQHFDV